MIRIDHAIAFKDGTPVKFVDTPNRSRGVFIEPHLIIIHGTDSRLTEGSAVSWLADRKARVSAHFVIERSGEIVQMVECNQKAWHCDPSEWNGRKGCNGFSIGIEMVEPGRLKPVGKDQVTAWYNQRWPMAEAIPIDSPKHRGPGYWMQFTSAQIEACKLLVAALAEAYPTITDVVGHYDVSPGRKEDPSPTFPLEEVQALLADRIALPKALVISYQERLNKLGYGAGPEDGLPGPRSRGAMRVFQEQHSLPLTGQPDEATMATLMSPDAQPMPNGARGDATKEGLKSSGSGIMSDASKVKRGSEISGGLEVANSLNDAQAGLGKVLQAKSFGEGVSSLATWALSPAGIKTIVVLSVLAFIWFGANRIEWRRLADHVRGLAVGR